MADPIATLPTSAAPTIRADDPDHQITVRLAPLDNGTMTVLFDGVLQARLDDGSPWRKVAGAVNLTYLVLAGKVSPEDAEALQRVLITAGSEIAAQTGATVTVPEP